MHFLRWWCFLVISIDTECLKRQILPHFVTFVVGGCYSIHGVCYAVRKVYKSINSALFVVVVVVETVCYPFSLHYVDNCRAHVDSFHFCFLSHFHFRRYFMKRDRNQFLQLAIQFPFSFFLSAHTKQFHQSFLYRYIRSRFFRSFITNWDIRTCIYTHRHTNTETQCFGCFPEECSLRLNQQISQAWHCLTLFCVLAVHFSSIVLFSICFFLFLSLSRCVQFAAKHNALHARSMKLYSINISYLWPFMLLLLRLRLLLLYKVATDAHVVCHNFASYFLSSIDFWCMYFHMSLYIESAYSLGSGCCGFMLT